MGPPPVLIRSPRHRPDDLALWRRWEAVDRARGRHLARKTSRAVEALRSFAAAGPCYAGTSWGKDSVVVAHLVATTCPEVPLVWIRVEPIANPDCALVRDAFLARWRCRYAEIVRRCAVDDDGEVHATGTLESGFKEAASRYGPRHVSGVRADESAQRKLRVMRWGESTEMTCAPIARWTSRDVFAYLAHHDLPVHPAYACLGGGRWDRERIRVASLGGRRGQGHGRAIWEREYYG